MSEPIPIIACVGRTAIRTRIEVDLEVWLSRDRRIILAQSDPDMFRLQGFSPDRVRWIDMDASFYQCAWMKMRQHKRITIEEAREALKR